MPKISARTLVEHRAETVDRLLAAFGDLLMSKGYDGLSLADVAAAAGLARTAIYNYFPDRETLLVAWTDREVQRTLEVLLEALEEADSHAEKLRVFVRLQLESFATRHLPPGQEVAQFLGQETHERFARHIAPLEDVLRDLIVEGVGTGEFAVVDPATTVPMVLGCIGAERVPLATHVHDVDEATGRVTEFLLRALGAQPKGKRKRGT